MFQEPFPAESRKGRTSGSSSKNSSKLVSIPFMSLDLTPGAGNLLDEFYWEILSPWRGEFLILNTGPAPRSGAAGSTLWSILEERPHPRYFLTRKACQGILRRAYERGKPLPGQLKIALEIQAGLRNPAEKENGNVAFHINQRDEGIDLNGMSGALMATRNMQMQTFLYYLHIIGEYHEVAGQLADKNNIRSDFTALTASVIPLANPHPGDSNPDLFWELEKHFAVIFATQKAAGTDSYIGLITDLRMLASDARKLASRTGGIDADVFEEYIEYAMKLIELLQNRIPALLQQEEFFTKAFLVN